MIQTDEAGEPEKTWLGASLTLGKRLDSAQVSVNYRTKRCAVVNLEPDSGKSNPEVLRHVAEKMQACAGVYGVVSRLGSDQSLETPFIWSIMRKAVAAKANSSGKEGPMVTQHLSPVWSHLTTFEPVRGEGVYLYDAAGEPANGFYVGYRRHERRPRVTLESGARRFKHKLRR